MWGVDMGNPFSRFSEAQMGELLSLCGFSEKQAFWLSQVLPKADDILGASLCVVVADKSGPEMRPFETTDEELLEEARALVQTGALIAWSPNREAMQ
jgi:hypothetical protein